MRNAVVAGDWEQRVERDPWQHLVCWESALERSRLFCYLLQGGRLRGVLAVYFSIGLIWGEHGEDSFDVPSCKHTHTTSLVVAVGTAEAGIRSIDPLAVPVVTCWEGIQVKLPC